MLLLIYYILAILLMVFFATKSEDRATAQFYMNLGIVGIVFVFVVDMLLVKKANLRFRDVDVPDSVTHESESPIFGHIPPVFHKLMFVLALLLAGAMIFFISKTPTLQVVESPLFSIGVSFGNAGSALLSGVAGTLEDLIWFGFIPWTFIFAPVMILTRNYWLALALTFLINPWIFTVYHYFTYSGSDLALNSIAIYAYIFTGLTILTGSLLLTSAIHFGNNFGITMFRYIKADISGYFYAYVVILIIIFAIYLILRRRRQ